MYVSKTERATTKRYMVIVESNEGRYLDVVRSSKPHNRIFLGSKRNAEKLAAHMRDRVRIEGTTYTVVAVEFSNHQLLSLMKEQNTHIRSWHDQDHTSATQRGGEAREQAALHPRRRADRQA